MDGDEEKVEAEKASTTEYLTPEQTIEEIKDDVIETKDEVTSEEPNHAYIDQKLEDIYAKLNELDTRTAVHSHGEVANTTTEETTQTTEEEKRPEPRHLWFKRWKFRD